MVIIDSGRSLAIKALLLAPLGIALLILAGISLIPIPTIATGRASTMGNNNTRGIDLLADKVLRSEECVERVACEVSYFAKNYEAISWIPR